MERRYHEPPEPGAPIVVPCRHCTSLNTLETRQIEIAQGRAWAKCSVCEDWFLVRWDDAVALGIAASVNAIDSPKIEHRD